MPSPSLPAPRIAYDRDGSFVFVSRNVGNDRSPFFLQPNALQRLNSDEFGGVAMTQDWWNIVQGMETAAPHFVSVLFPTPQFIVAWYASARSRFASNNPPFPSIDVGVDIEFQVSRDTTNGLDGSWKTMAYKSYDADHLDFGNEVSALGPDDLTTIYGAKESITSGDPQYKNSSLDTSGWQYIFGPAQRQVRGVRLYFPRQPPTAYAFFVFTMLHLHLYGYPDDNATQDRLEVVDSTSGDPKGDIHWGDIDYQASDTNTFKIKNLSATLTANSVVASIKENYPTGSGSSLKLSIDGGTTWASSVSLGNLAPGASSSEVMVQLDPVSGLIGQRFARVEAEVSTWT